MIYWSTRSAQHVSGNPPNPCLPQQQDTIPYTVKISVLLSWRWAKDCPKHVELILEINILLLLHLVGSSILLYLIWKTMVEPDKPQMTIWLMRITCWIPNATETHTVYVLLTAFPVQQWLQEHASLFRYSTLSVLLFQLRATSIWKWIGSIGGINLYHI